MGRIKGTRKVNGKWVVPDIAPKPTKALRKLMSKKEPLKGEQLTLPVPSDSQLLISYLQESLVRQRQDFEAFFKQKDDVIAMLKEDKARLESKVATYEMAIMPRSSLYGADVVKIKNSQDKPTQPNFPTPKEMFYNPPRTRWQQVQDEHERQLRIEAEQEKQQQEEKAREEAVNG